QLAARFEEAERDPSVAAIVFEGVGKAFVAGADIRFFVEAIKTDAFERIYAFTKRGQELFSRIATSEKSTIAFVDGIALGGGAELALACQKIVSTSRARFAFPETGIGIYPGLGGTQRLPRRVGKAMARYLILCGKMLGASDAFAVGLVDAVLKEGTSGDEVNRAAAIVSLAKQGRRTGGDDGRVPGWTSAASHLFSDECIDTVLSKELPDPLDEPSRAFAEKAVRQLSYKAPVALKIASKLIEEGSQVSIDEGLQKELDHLEEIFSTEDALEGLSSVGKRRAHFKGQ
ncbi:MAG: enoyl-CoA hydratase/isomerase family protein, partial [Rhodothermales bacterium]